MVSILEPTMSAAILKNPIFTDNDKAREWLEARVWANGRPCPHCGIVDRSTLLRGKAPPPRSLPVWRVPRTIYGNGRNRFLAFQNSAVQVVGSPLPYGREQEGYKRPSSPPNAGCIVQIHMVHDA